MRRISIAIIPVVAFSILLIVESAVFSSRWGINNPGIDFFTFWSVSQSIKNNPTADYYSDQGRQELGEEIWRLANEQDVRVKQRTATNHVLRIYDGKVDTTGTPLMYAAVGILSAGNYDRDHRNFILLSLIAFVISIGIQCHFLGYSHLLTIVVIALFLRAFGPLYAELKVGNVNSLQLLILTLFILSFIQERQIFQVLAGSILGMGLMFKPNIVIVVIYLLGVLVIQRETLRLRSTTIGLAVGIVFSLLLSWSYFHGIGTWMHWIKTIPDTLDFAYKVHAGNYGLASLINHWFGINVSLYLLVIISFAFFIIQWRNRQKKSTSKAMKQTHGTPRDLILSDAFMVTGVGCAAMLLSLGLAWPHYYMMLIPLILFVMRPTLIDSLSPVCMYAVKMAGLVSVFLLTSIPYALMRDLTEVQKSVMMNIAALILLVLGMIELSTGRTSAARVSSEVHP